ncbi:MAG: aminoacyl-tRNA hydrolase [Acidobacteria bacterium]|nr:aminoacyl-tRNA hydrolase [Acidobacteriota bacterium]
MPIELVLGLGNPGPRYESSRHNVGFRVVDQLRERRCGALWSSRPTCELVVAVIGGLVALARPLSFMNRSGEAAVRLLTELDLDPGSALVVVDDVDLPLGSMRLKPSGGPGTHNGLRDLVAEIGTGFPRLRVGVRGGGPIGDLADYVLAPFAPNEQERAEAAIERAADAVEVAVSAGLDRAMNEYNRNPDALRPD